MKIDLSNVINRRVGNQTFNGEIFFDSKVFKNFGITEDVTFNVEVQATEDYGKIFLEVSYDAVMNIPCSRCLQDVSTEINQSFDINVSNNKNQDSDDAFYFKGLELDLTELLLEDIIFNFPSHILCDDECKGLCPICGENLNKNQCNCSNDNIDPRLEGLKKFIK